MKNFYFAFFCFLILIGLAPASQAQGWACIGKTGCTTIGSVCPDGTVFAGCPANSYRPIYTTRCDAGEFWNGTNCTGAPPWKVINRNDDHSCGIKQDNTLWCWGEGSVGQLGDNTATDRSVPTQVNGGGSWKQVAVGGQHTCGIRSDDTMRCWGDTYNGALGDGAATQRSAPVTLTATGGWNTTAWKSVSAGSDTTCAIRLSDDALYCWGSNDTGGGGAMFGNGVITHANAPTAAGGGGAWKQVAVGSSHTCGIRTDDTIRCWGANYFGQLGDNTSNSSLSPVTIDGGGTWKAISAGGDAGNGHTCAIRMNNTMWCWGLNGAGQLGNGGVGADSMVPVAVSGGHTWQSVDVGGWTTCGIRTDGTLRCWGENANGQIGDNSTTDRNTPTAVGSSTWRMISTGGYDTDFNGSVEGSTCGITTDDTAFCWGRNTSGQVGDNSTTQRNVPTAVNGTAGARLSLPYNNANATGRTNIAGALSPTDGAANTVALVAGDADSGVGGTQPHQAAGFCDGLSINSSSDWYLPAGLEFLTMYANRTAVGQFSAGTAYWTSTQTEDITGATQGAYIQLVFDEKQNTKFLRCVRRD